MCVCVCVKASQCLETNNKQNQRAYGIAETWRDGCLARATCVCVCRRDLCYVVHIHESELLYLYLLLRNCVYNDKRWGGRGLQQ